MRLAALLLAAGEGRRYGGCKQLAQIAGKPLVRHALENLVSIFASDLYVVLGSRARQIRPHVSDLAEVIEHDGWSAGLGSSIACGVSAIERSGAYEGVLIALADHPALTSKDYARLLAGFDGKHVVASAHGERKGVPAVFPAAWFKQLRQLDGDRGAQALLQSASDIRTLTLAAAAIDVDRVADIEQVGER